MILYYKNLNIDDKLISFKKRIQYSEKLGFIPLRYNNDVFIVQTPILYSPFGISTIYNIIDLSFQCNDITNDFINNCLSKFYITTKRKYTNYIIEDYIRQNKYSKWMRFKVTKGTIFYNQDRDKIHTFESKVLGSYIIELSGLWIINGKISFNWSILSLLKNTFESS